jgi:hypothetical protein
MMIPVQLPKAPRALINDARAKGENIPIQTYANFDGIPGCQTKLVLGQNCGAVGFYIYICILNRAK